MKSNSQIRQETLAVMQGNWGIIAVIFIIYSIIAGACSCLYAIPTIFLGWPIAFGLAMLYLKFVRGEQKLTISELFSALKEPYYWKSVCLYLLTYIYTFLWTLLFIIPGIIKSLSYALAPYILADNPDITAEEAIDKSMKMMKGHKMDLFLMLLGYMGFAMLSIFALCIPLLWIAPYYMAVMAKFYEEVKHEYEKSIKA